MGVYFADTGSIGENTAQLAWLARRSCGGAGDRPAPPTNHPPQVTKPYKIIGFGAMEVTKPYKFIGFGAMEVTNDLMDVAEHWILPTFSGPAEWAERSN